MAGEGALDERIDLGRASSLLENFAAEELGEEIEEEAGAATDEDRAEPEASAEETEESEEESVSAEAEAEEEAEDTGEEAEAEEESAESRLYDWIDDDGNLTRITFQELRDIRDGNLRTADYTRKTQAVADERRKVESAEAETRRIREQYSERLEALNRALEGDEPNWDKVRAEQPEDYPRLYADWSRRQDERRAIEREQERVKEEARKDAQQAYEQHLEVEREKLLGAIPEWSDVGRADSEREAMVSHARALGFTPEEIAAASDHRTMIMLRNSMLYQKILAEGQKVVSKKKKAEEPLKPGTPTKKRKKSEAEKAADRLKRTGKTEDATRTIFHMLEGDMD